MCPLRIVTLGCRLNVYESEIMKALAESVVPENTIIVHTCSITAEAERQSRQTIRSLRKKNPDAYIIVAGCAVQANPRAFAAMPEVDRVLDNKQKMRAEQFCPHDHEQRTEENKRQEELPRPAFEGRAKAFIRVQTGCNHYCSYCIVPSLRGKSQSDVPSIILDQIRHVLDRGCKEVVLTGVDIASYSHSDVSSLAGLVRHILAEVPQLERLGISSLDPANFSDELVSCFSDTKRLLPHVHLSIQSGDDEVLSRMRRRHTRQDVIALCNNLRRTCPHMTFGADFIVGFPGETDAQFQNTLDLVSTCGITFLHVFPFSPRPNTLASQWPRLSKDVVRLRTQTLRDLGASLCRDFFEQQIGKETFVLVETQKGEGHSEAFAPVVLSRPFSPGTIVRGFVSGHTDTHLIVTPCE